MPDPMCAYRDAVDEDDRVDLWRDRVLLARDFPPHAQNHVGDDARAVALAVDLGDHAVQ